MNNNDEIELLDTTSRDGGRIYTRGLLYIMAMAFHEVYPEIMLTVNYQLSSSMFCKIENAIVTDEMLKKVKEKKKLLLIESIIACIDLICLLFVSISLSWHGLLIAYIITAFTATLADPIWGSIMSCYSTNNRTKWVLVNKVYFIIRAVFTVISWFVCRQCVIYGIESFRYLSIVLIILLVIFYLIANKINKKVFKTSI